MRPVGLLSMTPTEAIRNRALSAGDMEGHLATENPRRGSKARKPRKTSDDTVLLF